MRRSPLGSTTPQRCPARGPGAPNTARGPCGPWALFGNAPDRRRRLLVSCRVVWCVGGEELGCELGHEPRGGETHTARCRSAIGSARPRSRSHPPSKLVPLTPSDPRPCLGPAIRPGQPGGLAPRRKRRRRRASSVTGDYAEPRLHHKYREAAEKKLTKTRRRRGWRENPTGEKPPRTKTSLARLARRWRWARGRRCVRCLLQRCTAPLGGMVALA